VEAFPQRVTLGRSGLQVSKLGLGSSFNAPTASYLEAFDRGVNYFYWGSIRRSLMGNAIREIARSRRDQLVLVLQSYSRVGSLLTRFAERGLRTLGVEYADVLLLGWHNHTPTRRVLDAALALRERGRVHHIALSTHRRSFLPTLLDDETYAIWHVRYNAVHRGAEHEVFACLGGREPKQRPGIATYTTTRWGHLCDSKRVPPGERTPSGTDCYRFALSRPEVDLCVAGPDDTEQMSQALAALDAGPMDEEELAWMRRVGDHIYRRDRTSGLRDGPGKSP
jgi:aryl-alcohol dehydrogenase-like predicted oxidoreductase